MTRRGDRRDSDLDDWSVEPERASERSAPPPFVEDWLAGEPVSEQPSRPSAPDKAGLALAVLLLALFGGLAIAGVFTGTQRRSPPPVETTTARRPTTTTPSAATTRSRPVITVPTSALKPGDTGSQVTDLQQTLAALGYSTGAADGSYGPATQTAVARFQRASGLAADGVFGSQTLSALSRTAG